MQVGSEASRWERDRVALALDAVGGEQSEGGRLAGAKKQVPTEVPTELYVMTRSASDASGLDPPTAGSKLMSWTLYKLRQRSS